MNAPRTWSVRSLFRSLFGSAPNPRRRPYRHRLGVESLEYRLNPAPFSPLPATLDGDLGSLRADIITANTNGDLSNTFSLAAGTYLLSVANAGAQENAAATGDLDLVNLTGGAVASKTYIFQGAGAANTFINANQIDRVFQILGADVTVEFTDLTIENGRAIDTGTSGASAGSASGGGILDNGGTLTLTRVTMNNDQAVGQTGVTASQIGSSGEGGGIYADTSSAVHVISSLFTNNIAQGGDGKAGENGNHNSSPVSAGHGGSGGDAAGGGIFITGGSLELNQTTLGGTGLGNQALGGKGASGGHGATGSNGGGGGDGGNAQGGGVFATSTAITLANSNFLSNAAIAGDAGQGGNGGGSEGPGGNGANGGDAGFAQGGGLYAVGPTFTFNNGTFTSNLAQGGVGGRAGFEGNNQALDGSPGTSGFAQGGGFFLSVPGVIVAPVIPVVPGGSDDPDLVGAQLQNNTAQGGAGAAGLPGATAGAGAAGQGGGMYFDTGTLTFDSTSFLLDNNALGGAGGEGFASTSSISGIGNGGAGGAGQGGGLYATAATVIFTGTHIGSANGAAPGNQAVGGNGGDGGNSSRGRHTGASAGNGGDGQGGGVYANSSALTLQTNVLADFNLAQGGNGGDGGNGDFSEEAGGSAGSGGFGQGGGIYAAGQGSNVQISDSSILSNNAVGGDGGNGGHAGTGESGGSGGSAGGAGDGEGGGLFASIGTVDLMRTAVYDNVAKGGNGGNGGHGGNASEIAGNGADGGTGGSGRGGGLYLVSTSYDFFQSSAARNQALAGTGGTGGTGGNNTGIEEEFVFVPFQDEGAGNIQPFQVRANARNGGNGGDGGDGGDAEGGGFDIVGGDGEISDSTVSTNSVGGLGGGTGGNGGNADGTESSSGTGGNAGNGGNGGERQGGGVYQQRSTLSLRNSTIVLNVVNDSTGGELGTPGTGALGSGAQGTPGTGEDGVGGGTSTGGPAPSPTTVVSTIIALNTATTDPDVEGDYTSEFHNFIGKSDGSTGFTNNTGNVNDPTFEQVGTSANPIDPLLGALALNGGTTLNHLPMPNSPVIDLGSNPDNLSTDQRFTGFPRTLGAGTEVGSIEVPAGSLAGFIYVDANNNGIFENTETGITSVTVTLSGTNHLGNPVNVVQQTVAGGGYDFTNVSPGTYTITETSPAGFLDGKLTQGTPGGGTIVARAFTNIPLTQGVNGTDNNFAELLPSELAGFVYVDANNNGVFENTEAGITSVTVTLTGTDDLGQVNTTMMTTAGGAYSFPNLRPGTYTITETSPAGFLDGKLTQGTPGGGTIVARAFTNIALAQDVGGANNNFAELLPSSLAGFVYVDANNNGVFENTEAGITNVTVTLSGTDDVGPVNATMMTTAGGAYDFPNLRPGTYTITETSPAGYLDGKVTQGTPGGGTVVARAFTNISLAQDVGGANNNFAELLPSSLAGFVYIDANNDGIFQNTETGIVGVKVTLTGTNDLNNSVTLTQNTVAGGAYDFANLRPGTYTITETPPAGFLDGKLTQGTPGGGGKAAHAFTNIPLAQDITGTKNNFAHLQPSTITGFVYFDANDDGIPVFGELASKLATKFAALKGDVGINHVELVLTGVNDLGQTIAPIKVFTNATGMYTFSGLRPGTYTITEPIQPKGYLDGLDSKNGVVIPKSYFTDVIKGIVVANNASAVGNNFGELKPVTLSGIVFFDKNNNGKFNTGDKLLPGVTITLFGVNDTGASVKLVTHTNTAGAYHFVGLRPGTYRLIETRPPGYLPGTTKAGTLGGTVIGTSIVGIHGFTGENGFNYNFSVRRNTVVISKRYFLASTRY